MTPREFRPCTCTPPSPTYTWSIGSPHIISASSTARLIASTVASMLTTTPFRTPRDSARPTPMISILPLSVASPAINLTSVVPMSIAAMYLCAFGISSFSDSMLFCGGGLCLRILLCLPRGFGTSEAQNYKIRPCYINERNRILVVSRRLGILNSQPAQQSGIVAPDGVRRLERVFGPVPKLAAAQMNKRRRPDQMNVNVFGERKVDLIYEIPD